MPLLFVEVRGDLAEFRWFSVYMIDLISVLRAFKLTLTLSAFSTFFPLAFVRALLFQLLLFLSLFETCRV